MKKTIIRLIFFTCFILPQLCFSTESVEKSSISKPNIIFIMADDLGKLLLPVYGAKPVIKMPNLERLAKEGVVFKNAYATPLCFSTRAALVSGRYALNTGAYRNYFPDRYDRNVNGGRVTGFYRYFYKGDSKIAPFIDTQYTPSFALPLKDAGYATAIVGKWHLNDFIKQQRIFRTYGFDRWMISDSHTSAGAFTDKGFVATPGFLPSKMADFIINFITKNKNRPFFVYYPMHLVHAPYVVPSNPIGRYTHTEPEKHIAMIEYVDLIIGRLVATLEALDLKDNTIIFFSGDNGAGLNYRAVYELVQNTGEGETKPFHGKGSLYEGGVNVPLVVSGGPVIQRGETEALVDFTDILPTLADFAGLSVVRKKQADDNDYRGITNQYVSIAEQYKGDGYSIASFLTGQAKDTPRDWIMFADINATVIRDKTFKLWSTLENQRDQGYKLYDLYDDPYEQVNLYDHSEANIIAAKRRLENVLNGLVERSRIDAHFDPVDWNYGMLAHWTMDQSKFLSNTIRLAETESGYDAESNTEIFFKKHGKFNTAVKANRLRAPYSKALFYTIVIDDNSRFFNTLSGMALFYRGIGKLIRTNRTMMEVANTVYTDWTSPREYHSRRGDRKKFLSSMTVSGWVQTQHPKQNLYFLKQPYKDKQGSLIIFSITKDATVSFELTTNDKTRKLESQALDKQLWGQWLHIAATWDGRDNCGKAVLYVNGESVAEDCLGRPLSAEGTDDLMLGGFAEDSIPNNSEILVDDIAIWRQPLMPIQIKALYEIGNRFSYNASEVDALFNTPRQDGATKIKDHVWQQIALENMPETKQLTIREQFDAVEIQFGEVMTIRSNHK